MRTLNERHSRPLLGYPGSLAATSEIVTGAAVESGASANTKGAWVEQVAALPADVCALEIFSGFRVGVSGQDTGMLLDFAIGGAGSEVAVLENVVVGEHMGGTGELNTPCRYGLPLYLPAGARLSCRISATIALDDYQPIMCLYYGGPGFGEANFAGFQKGESYNINAATSSHPSTGNLTNNAWTEIVASTTEHLYGLTAHFCGVTPVAPMSGVLMTADVGIGPAGSEIAIGSYRIITSTTETITDILGPLFLQREIPVGSRLALRKNSTSVLGGNLIGWSQPRGY